MTRPMRYGAVGVALSLAIVAGGCRQDMHDQPKYEPLEKSDFFTDARTARPMIDGTVARGWLREDSAYYRGLTDEGSFVTALPVELDADLLYRGRERFEIFCSPCHGRTGDGQGMIIERGFKNPETFHQDRLREVEIGYFFDVMTNGFGQMSDYASQVPVADRWAIAAYIRTLQTSRHVVVAELPAAERRAIDSPPVVDESDQREAETH